MTICPPRRRRGVCVHLQQGQGERECGEIVEQQQALQADRGAQRSDRKSASDDWSSPLRRRSPLAMPKAAGGEGEPGERQVMPDRLLGIGELRAAQHAHMVQAAVCIGNRKARMGAANVADKSCLCFSSVFVRE